MMADSRFDVSRASKMDSEGRIEELRIPELLREIGHIRPGMVCVDLGCGTGTFSVPMSTMVGYDGRVFAVDGSSIMLDKLKAKNPAANISLVEKDFMDTGLTSGTSDFCLAAFVLHETNNPQALIDEASRLLKPGGRLLVLEWRPELEAPGPPKKIRISVERLAEIMRHAGFQKITCQNWTEKHYWGTSIKQC